MIDFLKLPASSYNELVKIIKAFADAEPNKLILLNDLSKNSGVAASTISRNSGFLVNIGLMSEGRQKTITALGKQLAESYHQNETKQIVSIWKEIIGKNKILAGFQTLQLEQTHLSRYEFMKRIIDILGVEKTNTTKSGAYAIIEILKLVNSSEEPNDKFAIEIIDSTIALPSQMETQEFRKQTVNNDFIADNQTSLLKRNFVHTYICESGEEAKLIIPRSVSRDDLLVIHDVFNTIFKSKFKI